jgi:hypothetical protein
LSARKARLEWRKKTNYICVAPRAERGRGLIHRDRYVTLTPVVAISLSRQLHAPLKFFENCVVAAEKVGSKRLKTQGTKLHVAKLTSSKSFAMCIAKRRRYDVPETRLASIRGNYRYISVETVAQPFDSKAPIPALI